MKEADQHNKLIVKVGDEVYTFVDYILDNSSEGIQEISAHTVSIKCKGFLIKFPNEGYPTAHLVKPKEVIKYGE